MGSETGVPTVAEAMKSLGYTTAQFGKNHLGDRNEFLPCVHGFGEFFGNLYHLNAEEEPENPDYPKDPRFKQRFGPRGVLHCWATDKDDTTVDPAYGKVHRAFLIVPAQAVVAKWLDSFKEFPIRQRPASFNLDDVMRKLTPQG